MIPDAVALKELRGLSRLPKTHFARLIYVGIVGVVLYQFSLATPGPYVSPSDIAHLGRSLFSQFFWPNLALVSIAAILAGADMLTKEVQRDTLELLFMTPLTSFEIILGKWRAAMIQTGTLILCGAPVAAICFYLGGIGWWELAWSLSVTLAMATLGTALSIYYSVRQPDTARVIIVSVLWMVLLAIPFVALVPLLPLIKRRFDGPIMVILILLVIMLSPWLSSLLVPVHAALLANRLGSGVFAFSWVAATGASFFVAWMLLRSAAFHLKRDPASLAPARLPTDLEPANPYSFVRFPGFANREIRKGVWEEYPILWKELAMRAAGKVHSDTKLYIQLYLYFGVGLGLFLANNVLGVFYFLWMVLTLLVILTGASLFVLEKRNRRFEMMLSSPVSARRIVGAKLMAGLLSPESWHLLILWLAVAVGCSLWAGGGWSLAYVAASGVFMMFAYAVSAAASLRARTLFGAFVSSVALLVALLAAAGLYDSGNPAATGAGGAFFNAIAYLNPAAIFDKIGHHSPTILDEIRSRLVVYASVYGGLTILLVLGMARKYRNLGQHGG